MKSEYYTFADEDLPRYTGAENVFGVGNVVTGQGNIRVSLGHSQKVASRIIENYLGVGDDKGDFSALYASAEARAAGRTQAVEESIRPLPSLSLSQVAAIERAHPCSARTDGLHRLRLLDPRKLRRPTLSKCFGVNTSWSGAPRYSYLSIGQGIDGVAPGGPQGGVGRPSQRSHNGNQYGTQGSIPG